MEHKSKFEKYLDFKRQEYEKHDFCKNYRLNDPIKEDIFNKKYSHPNFIHVFDPNNGDYTTLFFKSIDYRILDNNNYVIAIEGEPNLGKSEGGGSIAFYTVDKYEEIKHKKSKIHLGFSDSDFDGIIREMGEGEVAIRDESPTTSGTGSRNTKQNINNITQIVRAHQNFFILICPKRIEADVITYYLEAGGKLSYHSCEQCKKDFQNTSLKKCPDCGEKLSLNLKKCKLRFILYDPSFKDGKIPIGRIFLNLHDDMEYRRKYEMLKHGNIGSSKNKGGMANIEINADRLKRDFSNLFTYCKKKKVSTRANIKTQLSNHNIECELNSKENDMITGDVDYHDKVIQNVYNALKHPESLPDFLKDLILREFKDKKIKVPELPGIEKKSGFTMFVKQYYENNLPETLTLGNTVVEREDIIEVLIAWSSGVGIRNISFSIENLHLVLVNDIIKLFKDGERNSTTIPDDWRMYKCYEYWCSKKYDLKLISGHNQPDFFLYLNDKKISGECKLWDDIKKNISLDKRKKFHTHNNHSDSQTSFPVLFRNVKWGDQDYFFDVTMNGSNTFNFEKKAQYILTSKEQLHEFYNNHKKEKNIKIAKKKKGKTTKN